MRLRRLKSPKPHVQPHTRIYFTGADGSGKTTLVDYVARKYGLPMLNEIARNVLADGRHTFNEIRSQGSSASAFQKAVFERQFQEEAKLKASYVSDRSIDNLAYAVEHGRNFSELLHTIPNEYITDLRTSVVFVVRPQRSFRTAAATDPFRLLSEWDSQVRIDAHTEMLFKLFDVPYVVIAESGAAARESLVDWCLEARGFRAVRSKR